MGNKASSKSNDKAKKETAVGRTTATSSATKIKEPENLFVQLRDMAQVSFLIYSFARLLAAARILSEENRNHQNMKTKLFELQTFVDINGHGRSARQNGHDRLYPVWLIHFPPYGVKNDVAMRVA
ncbi:hypothetical protein ACA910_007140 [Epithemia clementina (nom. ined.)]